MKKICDISFKTGNRAVKSALKMQQVRNDTVTFTRKKKLKFSLSFKVLALKLGGPKFESLCTLLACLLTCIVVMTTGFSSYYGFVR